MGRRKGIGLEIEAEEGTPQSPESLAEIGQWEVGWWGRVYSASLGGNLGTREPGAYSPKRNLGRNASSKGRA